MYAVYQSGGPVYGVGTTPQDAETNAFEWLDNTEDTPILRISSRQGETEGRLYCRSCSTALAAHVEAEGGDVRYDVREGVLALAGEG